MGNGKKRNGMLQVAQVARAYGNAGLLTVAEVLWPTRCAICEAPGELVCDRCRANLHYLDQCRACHVCGAPYGMVQCTECNELSMADTGRPAFPFEGCVGALVFDDGSARIVRTYKDAGERGLADFMGYCIACAVPPGWMEGGACVVPVPATRKARLRRGFDHGCELAQAVAAYLDAPMMMLLEPGKARDQRDLGRKMRFLNAQGRFAASEPCEGVRAILVDDVYTTGATACAAADALLAAGAKGVHCATFAHVY